MPSALCLILFLCLTAPGFSQEISNLRVKRIPVTSVTLHIDTLSVIPGTLRVKDFQGVTIPDSVYLVDWVDAYITFPQIVGLPDSVIVEYRRYPLRFNQPYFHKDLFYSRIDPDLSRRLFPVKNDDSPFSLDGGRLNSSGSISRGISMGNNRDASLSSNLNLNLQGYLTGDFQIEASLSDANIPVQPEGTTQQIQEFDKIYLRIFNPRNQITGGDFEIRSDQSQFMKFFKKVQGLSYQFDNQQSTINNQKYSISAAVVKGKYSVNRIKGIEGNQGPYPLTGADGEQYFQVIAGSEKVYVDGKLLSRGEDADYVIDYNSAELRFTPVILITRDKRITVEFEYTERSYTRFLVMGQNSWTTKRSAGYIHFYSENDARNQPLLQELTGEDKSWLASIGDNQDLARISSIQPADFDADRVLYKLRDTTVQGQPYHNILVHSYDPDSARYAARFTFVGPNKGDYDQVNSSANGRVFQWVAPENGEPRGNYAPITRLVTPESKQMWVAGNQYRLTSRMTVEAEVAISRYDPNTFSTLDRDDNMGVGITSRVSRQDTLGKAQSILIRSWLGQRLTSNHFQAIERFRSVEFDRDWNLQQEQVTQTENYVNSGFQLTGKDSLTAGYEVEMLNFGSRYSGWRHHTNGEVPLRASSLRWNGSLLTSDNPLMETGFLRHAVNYMLPAGRITFILSEEGEVNRQFAPQTDTLLLSSFGYQDWAIQSGRKTGNEWPWMVKIRQRTNRIPVSTDLMPETSAWEIESWFRIKSSKGHHLRTGFHFRRLDNLLNFYVLIRGMS